MNSNAVVVIVIPETKLYNALVNKKIKKYKQYCKTLIEHIRKRLNIRESQVYHDKHDAKAFTESLNELLVPKPNTGILDSIAGFLSPKPNMYLDVVDVEDTFKRVFGFSFWEMFHHLKHESDKDRIITFVNTENEDDVIECIHDDLIVISLYHDANAVSKHRITFGVDEPYEHVGIRIGLYEDVENSDDLCREFSRTIYRFGICLNVANENELITAFDTEYDKVLEYARLHADTEEDDVEEGVEDVYAIEEEERIADEEETYMNDYTEL